MKKSAIIAIAVAVCSIVVGLCLSAGALAAIGFDFDKLNTQTFGTNIHTVTDSFTAVDIRTVEGDVHLYPAKDGECRVECRESSKIIHTVAVVGNTLTITRTDTRRWYERIGIYWGEIALKVYLPPAQYQRLYIQTVSGNIQVTEGLSFGREELHSTSGNVTTNAAVSDGLLAKTVSGDLSVSNVQGGQLELQSTSGNLQLSACVADTLTAKTTSGDLRVACMVSGHAQLISTSGNVRLDGDATSLYLKTVSGDIRASLHSNKSFATHTVSGTMQIPGSVSGCGTCEIFTTSGNAYIEITP